MSDRARAGAGGRPRPRVEQPGGLQNPSWEAFFGLGQRKPPRPRKESRFGAIGNVKTPVFPQSESSRLPALSGIRADVSFRGLGACAPAAGRDYCQRSAGGANARSRWLGRKEVSGFQPIKSAGTQTTVHHFAQTCASQTAIFLSGSGTLSFVLSKESVPAGPGAASPEIPAAGVAAYKAYPPWRDKK